MSEVLPRDSVDGLHELSKGTEETQQRLKETEGEEVSFHDFTTAETLYLHMHAHVRVHVHVYMYMYMYTCVLFNPVLPRQWRSTGCATAQTRLSGRRQRQG